ncbi:MAG TPA: hypothetical protein VD835_17305 [Pyrinomonadaceae bacterium]|nr:hypothetical protein [Pyrinomonadaceae bacterium]
MSITIKYFRTRLMILVALIAIAVSFATESRTAVACQQCVFPTGGICVGCTAASGNGYVSCIPDQSTCTCTVGGGGCQGSDDGFVPVGGGVG